MQKKSFMHYFIAFITKYRVVLLLTAGVIICCIIFFDPVIEFYHILTDRDGIKDFINSWGKASPLVFILVQIFQVIFAPVPGEISGFVGGYLFGSIKGFIYSSIGLAIGSAINFWIGRILGIRYIRNLIPVAHLEKLDMFLARQGIIVLLIFFIFPGFPKDYLCLFLGVTALPFDIFILLAAFGRMPGTLMLSLQGELLYTQNYGIYIAIFVICLLMVLGAVKYREALYKWAERINKR